MNLKSLLTTLRTPNLVSMAQIMRDWSGFIRLHFLHAAIDAGLLDALQTPTSQEDLIRELEIQRPELLEPLLQLGLALGELSQEDGLYAVKGRRSRALLSDEGDMLAALIQESVTYYNSVYRHLTARLRGAPLDDQLDEIADLVARTSKLAEPFLRNFVAETVSGGGPMRILDVGCGSGVYLHSAAQANPQVSGVGMDMDETVVAQARRNLERWGIKERFQVLVGDVRRPPSDLVGPFDLITLYNVIYYFPVAARPDLFRSLQLLLAPGGGLAIVSSMQAQDVWAANLDLVTRSTAGCAPLPKLKELGLQLGQSGFDLVKTSKLMPGSPLYGILARRGDRSL